MKPWKNRVALMLLSPLALLGLVSCGESPSSSSPFSSPEASISPSSLDGGSSYAPVSSEPEGSSAAESSSSHEPNALERYASLLEENGQNCLMEADAGTKISYYGEDAIFYDYPDSWAEDGYEDFGYLRTSQGLFQYTYGEEGVVLGSCGSVAQSLPVSHFCYYPSDIFSHPEVYLATSDAYEFTSADTRVIAPALVLDSIDSGYASQVKNFAVSFSRDLSQAYVTWKLLGDNYSLYLHDVGTTESAALSSFLANPPTVEDPTDWTSQMKQDMASVLGKGLPFLPTATYAGHYDEGEATYTDFACGDQVASYGALLLAEGYALSEENGTSYENGASVMKQDVYLQYVYEADRPTVLDRINMVKVTYGSGEYFDEYYGTSGVYAAEYPQGEFDLYFASQEYYSDAKYNADVAKMAAPYGDFGEIPSFVLGEDLAMDFVDQSELGYYMMGYLSWHLFTAELSSSEAVDAALHPYIEALEKAGFVNQNKNKVTDYSNVLYKNCGGYALVIEVIHSDKNPVSFTLSVSMQYKIDTPIDISWEEFDAYLASAKKSCAKVQALPENFDRSGSVTLIDYTEAMKAEYEGKEAKTLYFSYYFAIAYDEEAKAKKAAYLLSASLANARYQDEGNYSLDADQEVGYVLHVSNGYTIDVDIQYSGVKCIYSLTGYLPA